MRIIKGFKVKILPTPEQERAFIEACGAASFLYNHFLRIWNEKRLYNQRYALLLEASKNFVNFKPTWFELKDFLLFLGWKIESFEDKNFAKEVLAMRLFSPDGLKIELLPSIVGTSVYKDKEYVKTDNLADKLDLSISSNQMLQKMTSPSKKKKWNNKSKPWYEYEIPYPKYTSGMESQFSWLSYLPGSAQNEIIVELKQAIDGWYAGNGFPKYKKISQKYSYGMEPGGAKKIGILEENSILKYNQYSCKNSDGEFCIYENTKFKVTRSDIQIPFCLSYKGNKKIKLARPGYLPYAPRDKHVKYISVRISRSGGKYSKIWNLSLTAQIEPPAYSGIITNDTLGLDLNCKDLQLIADSEGCFYPSKSFSSKLDERIDLIDQRIENLQKILSRKNGFGKRGPKGISIRRVPGDVLKPSNRWIKLRSRITALQNKRLSMINDQRHQVSKDIVDKNFKSISILDDKVSEMVKKDSEVEAKEKANWQLTKDRNIRKQILKAGMYEIKRQIIYKEKFRNRDVSLEESYYSSQQCSKCGHIDLKNISDRKFLCTKCGFKCHRDTNAALTAKNPNQFRVERQQAWEQRNKDLAAK